MNIYRNRRRIHSVLPFPEGILRTDRYLNNFPNADGYITCQIEPKHPAWLDKIIIVMKGNLDKQDAEVRKTMTKREKK